MTTDITSPLAGVQLTVGDGSYAAYDHGAHLFAWQPDGAQPVLWMSAKSDYENGKPIRGGVPVIFPWFGTGRTGKLTPAHGFVRLQAWKRSAVASTADSMKVVYEIDSDATGEQSGFPYPYVATLTGEFTPTKLTISLTVSNTGDKEFSYEEALHTYLAVGDVREVTVTGLEGADYLDRAAGAPKLECVQDGPITITGETDRLYMSTDKVTLDDPVLGRKLIISKKGSANTVVWNPWIKKAAAMADFGDDEWPGMICIEAANALDNAVVLAPGASHTMVQAIELA